MKQIRDIPKVKGIDHTIQLMNEGYTFISSRCEQVNSPLFKTRLLGKETICLSGKEAAALFYDEELFRRNGVAPNRIVETLFGQNSVQTLDDRAHKNRKELLMSAMTSKQIEQLITLAKKQWNVAINEWEKKDKITFYQEVQEIMCQIALAWTGLPIQQEDIEKRTKDLSSMYESASVVGPRHWAGRQARNRTEKWISEFVDTVRAGNVTLDKNMVLHTFIWHRDKNDHLLDSETVAVEVINLLRPIVAISVYINFIALALHHYPAEKEKVKNENDAYAKNFVQEVRRFYPFFPFAMAQVKKDFTWNGYSFERNTLTLLDLYGTNRDQAVWEHPERFDPSRFYTMKEDRFTFIPQGGGDYFLGHRCAGEFVTIELMKVSLEYLVYNIEYELPKQNLDIQMGSMPSIPKSNIILMNIRKVT